MERLPSPLGWAASRAAAVRSGVLTSVLTGAAYLVSFLAFREQYRANPPTCQGIGFGCRPDPSTSLLFLVVVVTPFLLLGLLAIVLGHVLVRHDRPRRLRVAGACMVVAPVGVAGIGLGLAVFELVSSY